MTMELAKKYRPKLFKEVMGQKQVVHELQEYVKKRTVPHCVLFCGPSGTGKTTLARIVANKLNCGPNDYVEINGASTRGIDDIRDRIERRMGMSAMRSGGVRVYCLDEAHKLTNDAQNALLKILEEPPKHVYFMICTTAPKKLIDTIQNRCTTFALKLLANEEMESLIERVLEKERLKLTEEMITKLVEVSSGSPRKALVILDKVVNIDDPVKKLAAIRSSDAEKQAIDLVRLLQFTKPKWPEVVKILDGLDEPEESFRHLVLGYAKSVLKGGGKFAPRAFLIIQAFRDDWYSCGQAGLYASCYEVSIQK
jgi:DNA polymerase III gamma/tau subunit